MLEEHLLPLPKQILISKLRERTKIHPLSKCWIYEGVNTRGHGQLRYEGRSHGVHRLSAYIYFDMELNDPIQVNHKVDCYFKNCWNPDHLYLGNQSQNIKDTIIAGTYNNQNTVKTHCKNGHLLPEPDDNGHRRCKICITEYQLKYNKERRPELFNTHDLSIILNKKLKQQQEEG